MEEIDKQGRNLSTTVWTQLDRKAGAITELTIRQLRNRISTWVVLGVGVLLISLLLIFYIDYQISLVQLSISIKEMLTGMTNLEIIMVTILGFLHGVILLLLGLIQKLRTHFSGTAIGLIGIWNQSFVKMRVCRMILLKHSTGVP